QSVVITAHLDHLGIGAPINGDTIYNGAVDNATGVSSAIEVARAFAALPKRPPRSILVVGVTGEEKGLQGSEYFAHHPTVSIDSIVANVNIDVVNTWWRPYDIVAEGAEHSSIQRDVDAALKVLGLKQSPDPEPEQVFFIRSDQYSFVKQGIPSVHASSGWQGANGDSEKNKATADWWTRNRYHQPSDEWDPKGDYEAMAVETRVDFLVALSLALDPDRPRWNDGDVFGKIFARR
ncbi:MAG: M20/M25/M40 family metallo-hydrolase, partial [Myxococcales bacterium]